MTVPERFTYCMLHAELASQICDEMPATLYCEKRIFAYPADSFGNETWSERQVDFLAKHRSEVINLLRVTIRRANRVGSNLKMAIMDIGAWELIPDVLAVYQRGWKDNDIPSLLCRLMDEPGYAPFKQTEIFRKLYGKTSQGYKSFIGATPENKHG